MFTNRQVNAISKWSFMEHYRPRIIDAELSRRLASKGAVLVEGPKWCGKTTSAIQVAKSAIRMDDPARSEQYIAMADIDPQQLLAGDVPRLVDEWQRAPKLWDAVRYEVDRRGKMGQFILTGSAVPPDEADMDEKHTGTGRISWATMRPMTLWESGESNGAVSLEDLFSTPERITGTSNRSLGDIAFSICRGGWPLAVDLDGEAALDQAIDYVDAVVHKDINRVDGVQKNPDRVRRVLRAYSRHQAQQVPYATLSADIAANEAQGTSDDTISQYASALRRIFVVEDMPAWNPNLRSKAAIRTSDTRFFVDPSIAAASLGIGPDALMGDLSTMGLLFEALATRDLRVYAQALRGEVRHFRDSSGLECDAVVCLRDGSYGLVEVKLGGDKLVAEGAANLIEVAGKVDTSKMPAPSFAMVLTAVGEFAFRRKDGVYVVPISCLKN